METKPAVMQNATGEAKFVFDAIIGGSNFFEVSQSFAGAFPKSNFEAACAGAGACFAETAAAAGESDVMRGFLIEALRGVYAKAIGEDEPDYGAAIRALSEIAKLAGVR